MTHTNQEMLAAAEALEKEADFINMLCLSAPPIHGRDIGRMEAIHRELKGKFYRECESRLRVQAKNLRALAARPEAQGDGEWVLVPKEPAEEMLRASLRPEYRMAESSVEWHRRLYAAMLAALPPAPKAKEE